MTSNKIKQTALIPLLVAGMMNNNSYPKSSVGLPPKPEKIIPPEIKEARKERHRAKQLQKRKQKDVIKKANRLRIERKKAKELREGVKTMRDIEVQKLSRIVKKLEEIIYETGGSDARTVAYYAEETCGEIIKNFPQVKKCIKELKNAV